MKSGSICFVVVLFILFTFSCSDIDSPNDGDNNQNSVDGDSEQNFTDGDIDKAGEDGDLDESNDSEVSEDDYFDTDLEDETEPDGDVDEESDDIMAQYCNAELKIVPAIYNLSFGTFDLNYEETPHCTITLQNIPSEDNCNIKVGPMRWNNIYNGDIYLSESFDMDAIHEIPPNGELSFDVNFTPNTVGEYYAILEMDHNATSSPHNTSNERIKFNYGTVERCLYTAPNVNTYDFGDFHRNHIGNTYSQKFAFANFCTQNISNLNLNLKETDEDCSNFSLVGTGLPVNLEIGGQTSARVQFTPTRTGDYNCTLEIEHDDAEVREIALTAQVVEPVISCLPTKIDFGEVQVGESKSEKVTCYNIGTGGLEIISVLMPPEGAPAFSHEIEPRLLPIAIYPGSPIEFDIFYSPDTYIQDSSDTNILSIYSNDVEHPVVNIQLTGTPIPAR